FVRPAAAGGNLDLRDDLVASLAEQRLRMDVKGAGADLELRRQARGNPEDRQHRGGIAEHADPVVDAAALEKAAGGEVEGPGEIAVGAEFFRELTTPEPVRRFDPR